MLALNEDDLITSNHRGHGQAIAKGIDLNGMMAEILGKYTGTCKGKGGSMHIADLDAGNLGANGIVGGGMGIAVGAALTQQMHKTGKIVVCFFGDGAGAVVLSASDEPGIIHGKLKADGNYLDLLNVPGQIANGQVCGSPYISMDGPGVFKLPVKMLSKIADDVIEEAGYTADQIDWIVPHQANKRIIDSTAKHLGLSMDKVILTVQDHGNTSAASIPLALDVGIKNGQIKRGQNLLLEGIGGGFAWGAVLVKY